MNRRWNEAPRLCADGDGLWCDEDGVRLGRSVWLVRRGGRPEASGRATFRRLPHGEVRALLDAAYGQDAIDADRVVRGLDAAVRALDDDAPVRAILVATFLGLPRLDHAALRRLEATATLLKAGYDPAQPRDEGGRWTDAGGGTGDLGGGANEGAPARRPTQVASAMPTTLSDATQVAAASGRHWEGHPNPEFRQGLAEAERSAEHKNHGYQQRNQGSNALGRYQFTEKALIDVGLKTSDGQWTGKYGIRTDQDFLNDPEVQERALSDYLARNEIQLQQKGAKRFIGQTIAGERGRFTITEAGLASAAHRRGAEGVRQYLDHQRNNGWTSDFSKLPKVQRDKFMEIETRLRTFQHRPYRPNAR
jgi:hypothetical protein